MEAATYMLLALGILGAIDLLLFHTIAHGIRRHRPSRAELMAHSLRGPVYALLFVLIPNFACNGAWYWALLGLLLFDLAVSLFDFAVEKQSRSLLGGLPTAEYILHMIMAMLFGAMVATIVMTTDTWARAPTALVYAPVGIPGAVRLLLGIMAIGVLTSGIQDARAVLRMSR